MGDFRKASAKLSSLNEANASTKQGNPSKNKVQSQKKNFKSAVRKRAAISRVAKADQMRVTQEENSKEAKPVFLKHSLTSKVLGSLRNSPSRSPKIGISRDLKSKIDKSTHDASQDSFRSNNSSLKPWPPYDLHNPILDQGLEKDDNLMFANSKTEYKHTPLPMNSSVTTFTLDDSQDLTLRECSQKPQRIKLAKIRPFQKRSDTSQVTCTYPEEEEDLALPAAATACIIPQSRKGGNRSFQNNMEQEDETIASTPVPTLVARDGSYNTQPLLTHARSHSKAEHLSKPSGLVDYKEVLPATVTYDDILKLSNITSWVIESVNAIANSEDLPRRIYKTGSGPQLLKSQSALSVTGTTSKQTDLVTSRSDEEDIKSKSKYHSPMKWKLPNDQLYHCSPITENRDSRRFKCKSSATERDRKVPESVGHIISKNQRSRSTGLTAKRFNLKPAPSQSDLKPAKRTLSHIPHAKEKLTSGARAQWGMSTVADIKYKIPLTSVKNTEHIVTGQSYSDYYSKRTSGDRKKMAIAHRQSPQKSPLVAHMHLHSKELPPEGVKVKSAPSTLLTSAKRQSGNRVLKSKPSSPVKGDFAHVLTNMESGDKSQELDEHRNLRHPYLQHIDTASEDWADLHHLKGSRKSEGSRRPVKWNVTKTSQLRKLHSMRKYQSTGVPEKLSLKKCALEQQKRDDRDKPTTTQESQPDVQRLISRCSLSVLPGESLADRVTCTQSISAESLQCRRLYAGSQQEPKAWAQFLRSCEISGCAQTDRKVTTLHLDSSSHSSSESEWTVSDGLSLGLSDDRKRRKFEQKWHPLSNFMVNDDISWKTVAPNKEFRFKERSIHFSQKDEAEESSLKTPCSWHNNARLPSKPSTASQHGGSNETAGTSCRISEFKSSASISKLKGKGLITGMSDKANDEETSSWGTACQTPRERMKSWAETGAAIFAGKVTKENLTEASCTLYDGSPQMPKIPEQHVFLLNNTCLRDEPHNPQSASLIKSHNYHQPTVEMHQRNTAWEKINTIPILQLQPTDYEGNLFENSQTSLPSVYILRQGGAQDGPEHLQTATNDISANEFPSHGFITRSQGNAPCTTQSPRHPGHQFKTDYTQKQCSPRNYSGDTGTLQSRSTQYTEPERRNVSTVSPKEKQNMAKGQGFNLSDKSPNVTSSRRLSDDKFPCASILREIIKGITEQIPTAIHEKKGSGKTVIESVQRYKKGNKTTQSPVEFQTLTSPAQKQAGISSPTSLNTRSEMSDGNSQKIRIMLSVKSLGSKHRKKTQEDVSRNHSPTIDCVLWPTEDPVSAGNAVNSDGAVTQLAEQVKTVPQPSFKSQTLSSSRCTEEAPSMNKQLTNQHTNPPSCEVSRSLGGKSLKSAASPQALKSHVSPLSVTCTDKQISAQNNSFLKSPKAVRCPSNSTSRGYSTPPLIDGKRRRVTREQFSEQTNSTDYDSCDEIRVKPQPCKVRGSGTTITGLTDNFTFTSAGATDRLAMRRKSAITILRPPVHRFCQRNLGDNLMMQLDWSIFIILLIAVPVFLLLLSLNFFLRATSFEPVTEHSENSESYVTIDFT